MKLFLTMLTFMVFLSGCSVKQETLAVTPDKVQQLTTELTHLSDTIDYQEARMFAYEALLYPQILAKRYGLVSPPTMHNFLINTGLKERGLCYEWSEDMITHLKNLKYQSFDLRWGVANKGEFDEHNSVVVVAKGAPFRTGLLIDPWRNSGALYWAKIGDDPVYRWVENPERSRYYGTIER